MGKTDMSVIRVNKDKNYFAASNLPFNDKSLSWEARGVMGYLLSKPDDWQVMFNDLVNQGDAAAHKVRRILKELEEHGYLKRTRKQDENGKFTWESIVYENPTISRKSVDGKTISRLSIDGSSIYGKPRDILSTESLSTESPSTEDKHFTPQQVMVGILAEITGLDYHIKSNAGRLARRGKELITAGYTCEQIKKLYGEYGWWYREDWRGQKGQKPTPEDILSTIKQAVGIVKDPKDNTPMQIVLPEYMTGDINGR
jgi:hypothetical protein